MRHLDHWTVTYYHVGIRGTASGYSKDRTLRVRDDQQAVDRECVLLLDQGQMWPVPADTRFRWHEHAG